MPLPNLLIIGAQKCGTTSLWHYLNLHPEVSMSDPKELDFFIAPDDGVFPVGNWHRGLDWYSSHFSKEIPIQGEASPNYTVHPLTRGVPERAAALVPAAKIVYMVRDPIDRIVSHYLHRLAAGKERRSLDDALTDMSGDILARGFIYRSMYFMQLEQWLECFPESSVLVLDQEDLRERRLETLQRVFRFLGVDESFSHDRFLVMRHVSSEKREPTRAEWWLRHSRAARGAHALPAILRRPAAWGLRELGERGRQRPAVGEERRRELRALLEEDAARLRTFTGRQFSSWSV